MGVQNQWACKIDLFGVEAMICLQRLSKAPSPRAPAVAGRTEKLAAFKGHGR